MNQPQSTYKSDYSPHAWFENNFNSSLAEFCSSENIDDCLKYVSQEFSALGYPSIYSTPSSCPYAVNCDIVKLLNVVFELLKDFKCHAETREELECRNQQLLSDLNVLNKKNSQLKERLEQTERKYNGSLEKERQLKCKNDNLQCLIKTEKDEAKKLLAQIQNQKIACQHEIRKYESSLNQMKSRLNQVLADKNPTKKIANISTSYLLQRNSNQRGKWKTGSSAKNSAEDMYNSVISNFDDRCQMAVKEVEKYQQILKFIEFELEEMLSKVTDDSYKDNLPSLYAFLNGKDSETQIKSKFNVLLSKFKEIVVNKHSENKMLALEVVSLESGKANTGSSKDFESGYQKEKDPKCNNLNPKDDINQQNRKELFDDRKEKKDLENLNKEKTTLSETLAQIKNEKAKLEAQKLEMIKLSIDQKSSVQPRGSKSLPSFSIITSKDGVTSVPVSHQLKQFLKCPDQIVKSISPLWKTDIMKSEENSISTSCPAAKDCFTYSSPEIPDNNFATNDLPKWAQTALNTPTSIEQSFSQETSVSQNESCLLKEESFSNEEIALSELQSSEEDYLAKLKAAIKDIENRRNNTKFQ